MVQLIYTIDSCPPELQFSLMGKGDPARSRIVQSTHLLEITYCLSSLSQQPLEICNRCHATVFVICGGYDAIIDDEANVGLALVQVCAFPTPQSLNYDPTSHRHQITGPP
jgi:hypothetical protein